MAQDEVHDALAHPELEGVLAAAYDDIKKWETQNGIDCGEECFLEYAGLLEVDPDELNEFVHRRDPHALEFFGLTGQSEEELAEWDANDLDKLPLRRDFEENFKPSNPFDECWELIVQFAEADEFDDDSLMNADLEEPEARETLTWLLSEAKGDYSVVKDYISRCSDLYTGEGSLTDLALEIAQSLGTDDYSSVCCNE